MSNKPAHQVTLVSERDLLDDERCPVCVESLSSTFRLPGEKPHIVPECGHALHEECFVHVYGEVPKPGSRKNLGVCGVCRQPMRISEGGEQRSKANKFAMLTGQSERRRDPSVPQSVHSREPTFEIDLISDDPIEGAVTQHGAIKSLDSDTANVVVPAISIRPEMASITRQKQGTSKALSAIVTVQVPSAGDRGRYPARPRSHSGHTPEETSPRLPPSPQSNNSQENADSAKVTIHTQRSEAFTHVVGDLQKRITDPKGSGLDQLGPLRLFDLLSVRKGPLIKEFHIYLFQDALLCISEEKKSGIRGIFSSNSSVRSHDTSGTGGSRLGALKLKGRIYLRHVKQIIDSSINGELSLTIAMADESMEAFILCFRDRTTHEIWRSALTRLLEDTEPSPNAQNANKIAKLLGADAPTPLTARTTFTNLSSGSGKSGSSSLRSVGDLKSPIAMTSGSQRPPAKRSPPSLGDLIYVAPLAPMHTALDLVIILSLPEPTPDAKSVPLKPKLLRQAVQFALATVGPRDRVSLVACELGSEGSARKTPLLNATRYESRKRLENFVDLLGSGRRDNTEFDVEIGPEEHQDVVTAVNLALDVVLQRKVKNPLTGIILISDTADMLKRGQMDLVTARLDAAGTPVHTLGYGKTHDPTPLWMISNHTYGTYTFVREWAQIREAMAGVLGGLMSIALTNMKLNLTCQDHEFKVVRVAGVTQSWIAPQGKSVDIELRELRHGEIREILVDFDFDNPGEQRYSGDGSESSQALSASYKPPSHISSLRKSPSLNLEGSFRNLDLESLIAGEDALFAGSMMDEVPVTEIDCSFHDPAAGKSVSHLAVPVLLTTTILPHRAGADKPKPFPPYLRRKMELLASDMITRALLVTSHKSYQQATRVLLETRQVLDTMSAIIREQAPRQGIPARTRGQIMASLALEGIEAIHGDIDMVLEGLEGNKSLFDRDFRNLAAQQATLLRTQKSWTTRSPTELLYCTSEVRALIEGESEWVAR